jgi:hypothetical protein
MIVTCEGLSSVKAQTWFRSKSILTNSSNSIKNTDGESVMRRLHMYEVDV